jgi:CheY-like chemotaxis protein
MNVLIVEDDLSIADLLQEALELDGYFVIGIARTVEEALDAVSEHDPDYAVVDVHLAGGGLGTEFGARLRKTAAGAGIIYSTGSDDLSCLTLQDGDAIMTKPYRLRDMGRGLKIIDEIARYGETRLEYPRNFRLLGRNGTRPCPAGKLLSVTVVTTLPLQATEAVHKVEEAEPLTPPSLLCALVVDDIAMNRDVARVFLCAAGHMVTCVKSGAEAIAAVAARHFDIILMDVRMPDMDGLEATRRIRVHEGTGGHVAILALTSLAFAEQVRECREAGMDGHLAKPFTQAALLNAIELAAEAVRPQWCH